MSDGSGLLVDSATLAAHLRDPDWVIVDCRFALADPGHGRAAWAGATIPGAVYAHLDEDLSAPVIAGTTGRHPLPQVAALAATLGGWGIGDRTQVVAFDDIGGAFAARLWWMLRWLGHDDVAVLDGGLAAWNDAGFPLAPGHAQTTRAEFAARPRPHMVVDAHEVASACADRTVAILDARAGPRFRGDEEPTDPIAGHIATAINAPFGDNLDASKRFRPAAELTQRYAELLGDRDAARSICYCGSGVTACHDILAMMRAGLAEPRLYAGSWSEWITDPSRPRETG